jgi:hypothetical protein
MVFVIEQSLVLPKLQHVPNVTWKLIDLKVFNQCNKVALTC